MTVDVSTLTREPADPIGNLLTIKEVALRLKVSKATVANLLDRGEIAEARIGRVRRVSERSLEVWLAGKLAGSGASGAGVTR